MKNPTFEGVLEAILRAMEAEPQLEMKELIEKQAEALELDDELRSKIEDAFHCIDVMEEKHASLQAAKEQGLSRGEWLQNDIAQTAAKHGLSEEQTENFIKALDEEVTNMSNEEYTKED